ncbi:hypothetical protein [Mangrovibacterium lignilyticum]|uniref:hypothetical protein n=1 Tax=Mangrovibacterium lignilyticum TaxID=2668052 RepID=UPI0013D72E7F|nr:hypothetical protein [Mangrovibacterium lignilyticum]
MKKTFSNLRWLPVLALILGVIAVSCKDDEVAEPVYLMTTNVTSISLDMNDGDVVTETITASTTKDGEAFTENYTFTSADPLVASVSNTGVVTAVGGGNTTVSVSGTSSGLKVTIPVEVIAAEPAPTFTELRLLNGSVEYTWDTEKMTVTDVVVYDEAGEVTLLGGDLEADKNAIDFFFLPDYTNGSFIMKPTGRSDKFKAGVTVQVKITVEGSEDPVWKNPTVHDQFATTDRTLTTISFDWDIACVNSGIVPAGVNVYLRGAPIVDGGYYVRGDAVSYAEVGSIVADTAVTVSALISNESYWFDIVDASGTVLDSTNTTMPSPISGIQASKNESVWYGDASSAQNSMAECRRITDRIQIGNGVTYEDISSVQVKDAAGNVLAEIGAWSQDKTVYEYSYINADAPYVTPTFDEAAALTAAYVHEKIDPADGKNGEFKYISFYDLPYSEDAYTVVLNTSDGESYEKTYNTKANKEVKNRAQVRMKYADATAINDANVQVMFYTNVPGDEGNITFRMSDTNIASISDQGVINFTENGKSVVYAEAPSGQKYEDGVLAALSYADNYWQFNNNGVDVAGTLDITFKSEVEGATFASATSSDEAIATVDGLTVTGVASGTAIITITDSEGNTAQMTVVVN